MPEIESTTDKMWWVDKAWGSRMDDIIRLGVSSDTPYENYPDSFIADVFPRARVNRFMHQGFTPNVTPSGDFLARMYEKYGAEDEVNGPGGYDHAVINLPANLSVFEAWKWNFDRRGGNREPDRPRPEEPEYAGYMFGSRAMVLSQVAEFTAEQAEHVASAYAYDQVGGFAPDNTVATGRIAIKDALTTKHSFVERDWNMILSNPVLPNLPAPEGAEQNLWGFITDILVAAAEEEGSEENIAKKRLGWIAQNPNSSEELLRRALAALENVHLRMTTFVALSQHPNLPKTDSEMERLLGRAMNLDFVLVNDEDFAAKAEEALKGSSMGPINRVVQELLYDPRREQFAKKLVRGFLRDRNWSMLGLFLPLLPAVLDDAEQEITGEVGSLPIEWLMEVI